MSERFSQWDSADYLKTEADIELYFDACIAEDPGDGSLIRHALGAIARARGITELPIDTGSVGEGLDQAVSRDANPDFSTVMKLIKALGLKLRADTAHA